MEPTRLKVGGCAGWSINTLTDFINVFKQEMLKLQHLGFFQQMLAK